MSERWPAAVIGGGVVGCAVLWELARHGVAGVLLEAESDLGEGASKANSAIVHTGFDSRPGTLESRLLRRAAELWPDVVTDLSVPFLPLGALMLARSAEEQARIATEIAPNAASLGVRIEILERDALREIAPFVTDRAVAALVIPDEAVIDPFWLTRALAEAAMGAGAEVRLRSPVVALEVLADAIRIRLGDGSAIDAEQVFDCAGLQADEIARLIGDESFEILPRKGQFLVSEEAFDVDRVVLPVPGGTSKGMLVTPIVFGGLLLGPTATDQTVKTDRSTDPATSARILEACSSLVPAVGRMEPIRSFAGLRTVSPTGDYVVRPSTISDRLFLVAGIRSTGVSASPAIAEMAVQEASRLRGWSRHAARALPPPPFEDRPPGEIVCLCRSVSRGEIEAACRRPTAPNTLDAIKRRGGALFGDCQGNLCAIGVAGTIAAERGVPVESIEKARQGSWLFRRASVDRAPMRDGSSSTSTAADVIVIGGGLAGVGAALSLATAGVSCLVVERGAAVLRPVGDWTDAEWDQLGRLPDGATRGLNVRLSETAVGLIPEDRGWRVLTQGSNGASEVAAAAVIVATGGYVQPGEHRPIAGPRLAGIYTADLVGTALDAGLAPGLRAVVVGGGRLASMTVRNLRIAGCDIVDWLTTSTVEEVRGTARLEAIRVDGSWLDCDTLVFADRLLAGPFILRGLGLVDARPGRPAPAGSDGSLPLPGLWAAGTCVQPDVDHRESLAAGLAVGATVAGAVLGAPLRT